MNRATKHEIQSQANTKENTMCTFCGTKSESLTIGSDGETTACPDCIGSADNV